ncbi:GTPase IMAP family member 9-like [Hemibagrus wyckioides]|uniref:GTPase IMAP family member 9-like n=1 Tax=Hemibagrus wyckioides TaxID=337641 RepID=UPI00266DB138|nr:GTPase IMAP family member 9-like [Hemibagrus wyckioides]
MISMSMFPAERRDLPAVTTSPAVEKILGICIYRNTLCGFVGGEFFLNNAGQRFAGFQKALPWLISSGEEIVSLKLLALLLRINWPFGCHWIDPFTLQVSVSVLHKHHTGQICSTGGQGRGVTGLGAEQQLDHDLSKIPDTLRIVLLGKTGVGKSASGNTILGKDVFNEDLSFESVTTVCQKETAEIRGRQITVIDSPGLFDTNTDNEETRKEIVKCISMAAPGPHVFLLVLKIGQRLTEEETEAVKIIEKTFGKTSNMYTIILFTGGDYLKQKTIEHQVEKAGDNLRTLISGEQIHYIAKIYHVFNNNEKHSNTQVLTLLDKIDDMVALNGGSYYTNEMFQQVGMEKQAELQERILKEMEEKMKREREELEAKYKEETERLNRIIQAEKQDHQMILETLKRRESDLKFRNEELQKMKETLNQERQDLKCKEQDYKMNMERWKERETDLEDALKFKNEELNKMKETLDQER